MQRLFADSPARSAVDLGEAFARLGGWQLHAGLLPDPLPQRYRISPRQQAPILRLDRSGRLVWSMGLWGFLVTGGKPGFAPTNARDDRLTSGWPWRQVAETQRCLIPADGFFEPEKPAGAKGTVPWSYYTLGNRQLFLMAGLWNPAAHPTTGARVTSYTVVTTEASEAIRLHDPCRRSSTATRRRSTGSAPVRCRPSGSAMASRAPARLAGGRRGAQFRLPDTRP
ncbi:MAG: SOS response-associated peptidase family protein [Geminicoccaceae bacterium]